MQLNSVSRPPKGVPLTLLLHDSQTDLSLFDLPPSLKKSVGDAMASLAFTGKAQEYKSTLLSNAGVPSVHFIGLGAPGKLSVDALARRFSAWAAQAPKAVCVGMAPLLRRVPGKDSEGAALRLLAGSDYRYQEFLGKKSKEKTVHLLAPAGVSRNAHAAAVRMAGALREGYRVARDLAHAPANTAAPMALARGIARLGKKYGWTVDILTVGALKRMKLPGIAAVGRGSENPPALVRIRGGGKARRVLIGKGVVFDSGGISIKPVAGMEEMKYDKCGAAGVLGALTALSELGRADGVAAYLPLAENLPGGRAFRPGDILTWPGGTSVEITTTDAEGRLILADALHLAAREKPEFMITLATLTGAMRFSLGAGAAGLFTRNTALRNRLLASGYASGEFCWELPLWEEYDDLIKGEASTLKNSSPSAGSIAAAAFLQAFAGEVPFAHVDIAAIAYRPSTDKASRGPTGFGVALLTHALLRD
jgi:leucyl aminopeptidase